MSSCGKIFLVIVTYKTMRKFKPTPALLLSLALQVLCPSAPAQAEELDYIVAVVEDDVVLNSELQNETAAIIQKLKANKIPCRRIIS